jgi:type II secretory pathway component PulF
MSESRQSSHDHAALEDLIALSDEMAALTRAGVPLEHGLVQAARDLRRRSGKLAMEISQRMQAGESLLHVIETSPKVFPPIYRAVVAAGLKAGRLPTALEGLATAARRTAELRRFTRSTMVYPVGVALMAFGLFVASLIYFQPRVGAMYESMKKPASQINTQLTALGETAFAWAPWVPLVILATFALAWFFSNRATAGDPLLVRLTPAGRMLHYNRFAAFSETLALLVDHGIPFNEAVVLAADASGDKNIQDAAHELAAEVERGGGFFVGRGSPDPAQVATEGLQVARSGDRATTLATKHDSLKRPKGFPPLVAWLLTSGCPAPALADSLRSTAEAYRRRATQLDDWLRLYLPLVLTIAIGGGAVVIYALSMLGPWFKLLVDISGKP